MNTAWSARAGKGFQSLRAGSTPDHSAGLGGQHFLRRVHLKRVGVSLVLLALLGCARAGPAYERAYASAKLFCERSNVKVAKFWWDEQNYVYYFTCERPYRVQEYREQVER